VKTLSTFLVAGSLISACPQAVNNSLGAILDRPKFPLKGEIHSIAEPIEWGQTLSDLTRKSELIAEGVVERSLASRQPSPGMPFHMETDAVFAISRHIKGLAKFPRVLVAENGGTVGELKVTTQEPIMQQGDHMVLFLQPDHRTNPNASTTLPGYIVIGVWNGKFKIENGKISVPPHSMPDLRSHQNQNPDSFLRTVSALALVDRILKEIGRMM
jgi:hypothetical protein